MDIGLAASDPCLKYEKTIQALQVVWCRGVSMFYALIEKTFGIEWFVAPLYQARASIKYHYSTKKGLLGL